MNENHTSKPSVSRVTRSKAQARANYNRLSRFYDLIASSEKQYIDRGLQILSLKGGETALEIGFGTGHAMIAMAQAVGESGKVYGVDISDGMLKITLVKIQQAGLNSRVDLRCEDATSLHYDRDFFDALFMSFTLELFDTPQIPLVLHECRRVLKSTGRICVVAMTKEADPGLPVRLYEWAHTRFPAALDCRPIYAQDELQKAGFRIEQALRESMWGLTVEIVLAKPPV
jgi:ubiquinone/menaquinone biosynthesis C-methylase UbiE